MFNIAYLINLRCQDPCVAIGPHADEKIDPITRHLTRY